MISTCNTPPGLVISPDLDSDALCIKIRQSRRILMHAVLYSNFAQGPVHDALQDRLTQPGFQRLTILALDWPLPAGIDPAFGQVLRQGLDDAALADQFARSRAWLTTLAAHPKVTVRWLQTQPYQPLLLLDDWLWLGQYAHSVVPAAAGVWQRWDLAALGTQASTLWQLAKDPDPARILAPWPNALLRPFSQCRFDLAHSTPFEQGVQHDAEP
ncbi:hypothetical protein [Ferrimonas pelagia]|uniref:Uncharacterized protein n=1 Tax=Ferrimonas pelagia TaxID=1177826 RepID=A0ABP9EJL0_9GAMM